jgi:hypothetical protein
MPPARRCPPYLTPGPRPAPRPRPQESKAIFVTNLAWATDDDALSRHISSDVGIAGLVRTSVMMRDGRSMGRAIAEFESPEQAADAVQVRAQGGARGGRGPNAAARAGGSGQAPAQAPTAPSLTRFLDHGRHAPSIAPPHPAPLHRPLPHRRPRPSPPKGPEQH